MTRRKNGPLEKIPLEQAVGTVLAHDITEIRPGQFKGAAFRKGTIIRPEHLPHLRRLGKEHLYVLRLGPDEVHEDDAAKALAGAMAGPGIRCDESPAEGKIGFHAARRGLFKVHVKTLISLNRVPDICCSSRHTSTLVEEGELLAATRVIPLVIRAPRLQKALRIAQKGAPLFQVLPLSRPDTALIITGNEVYSGLIEDKFAPVIRRKLQAFDCRLLSVTFCPDDPRRIQEAILDSLGQGAQLLLVAGGMSVDPDDVTRVAIRRAGAKEIVYGTPILPGAMFLYGRLGEVPVLGLPACILYFRTTVLDLMLPRVLAGERIRRGDLAAMAHGGLCLTCPTCRYPVCPFGKPAT